MTIRSFLGVVATMAVVVLVAPAAHSPTADAQQSTAAVPAAFLADPLAYFAPGREAEAVRYAAVVAGDPAAGTELRRNALLTAGAIELAEGRIRSAKVAFAQILEQEPSAEIEQPDRVPAPALTLFYRMRDSVCTARMEALVEQGKLRSDIRTIAVGDIENNSLVKGEFDLDRFARGLVHVLVGDLRHGTSLKVVDRQRLAVLREEIGMSRDPGLTDSLTRVRFGRLSGAQSFVFGQVMLLDAKHMRIDLRWVDTSTGEILLAESVDGGIGGATDLFKLERKLLIDVLAPRMEIYLKQQEKATPFKQGLEEYFKGKAKGVPPSKAYAAMMVRVGDAVASEDGGDFASAALAWKDVSRVVPADVSARARAGTLANFEKIRSD